jgi:hypothetical protein
MIKISDIILNSMSNDEILIGAGWLMCALKDEESFKYMQLTNPSHNFKNMYIVYFDKEYKKEYLINNLDMTLPELLEKIKSDYQEFSKGVN